MRPPTRYTTTCCSSIREVLDVVGCLLVDGIELLVVTVLAPVVIDDVA